MRESIQAIREKFRFAGINKPRLIASLCSRLVVAFLATIAPILGKATHAQTSTETSSNYLVYVGTYTSKGSTPTGSKGIYAYRFNATSGEIEPLGLAGESEQPSFLAVDPQRKFLYAVNETDTYQGQPSGGVSAFSLDRTSAKLTFLNEVPSRGGSPAHIAVDHTGKYVVVSNYNGGNLAVFPVGNDGKLGEATAFVQHHGSSVNKARQAGPHVHEAIFSPDNRFILSADLGLDEVFVYPFNEKTGELGPQPRVLNLNGGLGPRHMAFSPDGKFVYLVSENGLHGHCAALHSERWKHSSAPNGAPRSCKRHTRAKIGSRDCRRPLRKISLCVESLR